MVMAAVLLPLLLLGLGSMFCFKRRLQTSCERGFHLMGIDSLATTSEFPTTRSPRNLLQYGLHYSCTREQDPYC